MEKSVLLVDIREFAEEDSIGPERASEVSDAAVAVDGPV